MSVAVAKGSGGTLYGSATVVCDKRKAETEGSLALQAIGPGAFAVPAIPSGAFVNSFGFEPDLRVSDSRWGVHLSTSTISPKRSQPTVTQTSPLTTASSLGVPPTLIVVVVP